MKRIFPILVVILCSGLFGAMVASRPRWVAVGLVAGLVGLFALSGLARSSAHRVAIYVLVAVHAATVTRNSWLVEPLGGLANAPRLILAVILLALGLYIVRNRLNSPTLKAMIVPVACYGSWILIDSLQTTLPTRSGFLAGLVIIIMLDLCLVIAAHDDRAAFWETFLEGLVLVGSIACIASLYVWAVGAETAETVRYVGGQAVWGSRGIFFNPGVLGEQAATTAGAALAWRLLRPERATWWWYPVLGLSTACILISLSRSSLVGLAAGVLFYLYLQRGALGGWMRFAVQGGLLLTLGVALMTSSLARGALGRLFETSERIEAGEEGRVYLWRGSFEGLIENPLFGIGFGIPPLYGEMIGARLGAQEMASHSAFLEYAVLPGIPGLLLFAWLFFRAGSALWKTRDRALTRSILMLAALLLPIFVTGTSGAPAGASSWVLWTVLILGLALSTAERPSAKFKPQLIASGPKSPPLIQT